MLRYYRVVAGCLGEGHLGLASQVWELRFLPSFPSFPGKIRTSNNVWKTPGSSGQASSRHLRPSDLTKKPLTRVSKRVNQIGAHGKLEGWQKVGHKRGGFENALVNMKKTLKAP